MPYSPPGVQLSTIHLIELQSGSIPRSNNQCYVHNVYILFSHTGDSTSTAPMLHVQLTVSKHHRTTHTQNVIYYY